MFTVQFRSWYNNHNEFHEPETFSTIEEAIKVADQNYSMEITYMGDNCYNTNGLQTWVTDEAGTCIYTPLPIEDDYNEYDTPEYNWD